MKREELEVGKVYVNRIGAKRLILHIGKDKVFARKLCSDTELSLGIDHVLSDWKPKPKERKTITLTEYIVDGTVKFLTCDYRTILTTNKVAKISSIYSSGNYHIIKAPSARTITLDAETFEVVE